MVRRRRKDDADGRLFAIDITSKLINEQNHRAWEDELHIPWHGLSEAAWSCTTYAWMPPPFEQRIAAQNGGFLFGGVPVTRPGHQWKKGPSAAPTWSKEDVRRSISVPLKIHKADPAAGGVPKTGSPAYTFRIKADAKPEIRKRLEAMFGYHHRTIYPDFPGFAAFGSQLPASPP